MKRIFTMTSRNTRLLGVILLLSFFAFEIMLGAAQDRPAERVPLYKVEKTWVTSLAFSPDGQRLACDLVLRNLAGKEVAAGEVDKDFPCCMHVAFSPDGKWLASVHFDHSLINARHAICLWNVTADNKLHKVATLQLTKDVHPDYRESLYYLTFSPDSRMLATREPDDSTIIWETASGKERLHLATQGLAVAFALDGRTLTTVTRYGLVQHWDLATQKCVAPPASAKQEDFLFVENAIASADGKTLVLTDDYSVLLKNADNGKTLRRFENLHLGHLALSSDGKTLAAYSGNRVVLLDRDTGKELAQLNTAVDSQVRALAISPDAKSLAVAMEGSEYRFYLTAWEIAKLSPVRKTEVKPQSAPLEATLTSQKETYTLDLNGKTPEEFAKHVQGWPLPPSPKVDLVLTLRNKGTKTLTFHRDILLSLYLTGDGAMNHPMYSYQTEGRGDEPKKVTLAPGKTYEIPIQSLDRDHGERSYWLLQGEYTLHASCFICVAPAPDGVDKSSGDLVFVDIKAPPLRVKVVEEKK
jgi:dipeptidyl aminopeptidase/acylaminoacyl peptidase